MGKEAGNSSQRRLWRAPALLVKNYKKQPEVGFLEIIH